MSLKVNGDLVEGIDVLRQIAHFPLVHRTWMLRWRMRTSTTAARPRPDQRTSRRMLKPYLKKLGPAITTKTNVQ